MNKLHILLFLFLSILFTPSKCFSQDVKSGVYFTLLMKPNSDLNSATFLINNREKHSFKVDKDGILPSVSFELAPGKYNISVLTENFQEIKVKGIIITPNQVTFMRLNLNPKSTSDPNAVSIVKFIKPITTKKL